jgi:hypothetical protein
MTRFLDEIKNIKQKILSFIENFSSPENINDLSNEDIVYFTLELLKELINDLQKLNQISVFDAVSTSSTLPDFNTEINEFFLELTNAENIKELSIEDILNYIIIKLQQLYEFINIIESQQINTENNMNISNKSSINNGEEEVMIK